MFGRHTAAAEPTSMASDPLAAIAPLLAHLTTEARTTYPLLLMWGNAIWATLAWRNRCKELPEIDRPGSIVSVVMAFTFYGMFANLAVSVLCFGRAPSAFHSESIVPVFLFVGLVLALTPFNLFERVFGAAVPFFLVDSLGLLDATTTMFNYMEEAHATHNQHHFTLFVALVTFLGGGVARHFIFKGFVQGCATFDSAFTFDALFTLALAGTYYNYAILKCDGEAKCMNATGLYEQLAWACVAKNAYDYLPANPYTHGTSFVKKEMEAKAKGE